MRAKSHLATASAVEIDPTCQGKSDMEGKSHVSRHRRLREGLHTTIKKPHRLLAQFYNGNHGLFDIPNLTQPRRGLKGGFETFSLQTAVCVAIISCK